ncbi:MAG: hypothetical protein HQK51_20675 [Oligoflexia bacterium]|nr:hypothetical protein [Oligoflexia bacterium]
MEIKKIKKTTNKGVFKDVFLVIAIIMTFFIKDIFLSISMAHANDIMSSLKKLDVEIHKILHMESIETMFDTPRLLRDYGISYQPELVAPKNLTPKLSGCNLQIYAGIILYDLIYAVVSNKRQEIVESLQVMETIAQKLDLRSHADLTNHMFSILKKVASEPENVNIKKLINQMAKDFMSQIPIFMSSKETAHYMLDLLYGFTLEAAHVMEYFHRAEQGFKLKEWRRKQKPNSLSWMSDITTIFYSFSNLKKNLDLKCKSSDKLLVMKNAVTFVQDSMTGKFKNKEGERNRRSIEIINDIATMRSAIFANSTE